MHVDCSLYIHPFLKVETRLESFTCGRFSTALWCSGCFASKECDCNNLFVSNYYSKTPPSVREPGGPSEFLTPLLWGFQGTPTKTA